MLTAEPFLGADPFVMYLGDNLLQGGIADLVDKFREHGPEALILLTPVPDPENYGVAELDDDGAVVRLVEKPAEPASTSRSSASTCSRRRSTTAARAIEPSARGELEITDAIQWLVDDGRRVESHVVRGWWKDTGRLDDMLEANRLILETVERRVEGELVDSQVDGRVVVEAGRAAGARDRPRPRRDRLGRPAARRLRRALHRGRRRLRDRERRGRALDPARGLLRARSRGPDGVLAAGKNVAISRDDRQPRAYRFMVGDNSEIGIL